MNSSILVGNNLALLVAAAELVNKGRRVTLLTEGKKLGGHFAGVEIEGIDFDVGMVFFERCSSNGRASDLLSYDACQRYDWTRFGDLISGWIDTKVELVQAPTPESLVCGRRVPDYLIANRLDFFSGQPLRVNRFSITDARHASNKNMAGVYDKLSYAEAANFNHGSSWHQNFIEPFVNKVFGVTSADFLARFHRAAWAPLYYPETLELARQLKPTGLPEYRFWTSSSGFLGDLVRNINKILLASDNVEISKSDISSISNIGRGFEVEMSDKRMYRSDCLAVGLASDRAIQLFGIPFAFDGAAASVILLFALVRVDRMRASHGCTMVVDGDYAAYRVTDQDALAGLNPEWHRIVLEASPHDVRRIHPGKSVETALREELISLVEVPSQDTESVRVLRCFVANNAVPIPTANYVAEGARVAEELAVVAPGARFTGGLLGYGVASLNDQILQGLKISEEFL
jgi:hypothetical protein